MKYEELSEEAKERARDWLRYETDFDWWEPDYDFFDEVLENIGFADFKVGAFDLDRGSYIQWAGYYNSAYRKEQFNISEVPLPLHCVIKTLDSYDTLLKLSEPREALIVRVSPYLRQSISVEVSDYEYLFKGEPVIDQKAIEDAIELISDWMLSVLHDDYEHIMSDEYAEDCILCNDYDFDESGKIK